MTRIGLDLKFTDGLSWWRDPFDALDRISKAGLEGISLRCLYDITPTLDMGLLQEFKQRAVELELYVEIGIGKINPYMTSEHPLVRDLGDGSYLAGMHRLIETSAMLGWTELWTATGGFKQYPGYFFTDRFRTDADWVDQLRATEAFLALLTPSLRDTGTHLNIETHEEITSWEVVRLVETLGPDVLGVCLDPANVIVRGEEPHRAAERVGPYVRTTQLRDAIIWPQSGRLLRFLAPIGEGVIDWDRLLAPLLGSKPDLNLTIEGIGGTRVEMALGPNEEEWRRVHPDLVQGELDRLAEMAQASLTNAAAGTRAGIEQLRSSADTVPDFEQFVATSVKNLRAALGRMNEATDVRAVIESGES